MNPEYTSKVYCRCKHISENNRNGLKFLCVTCGFELNADLNGARNIEHRTRDYSYTLESKECLSITHKDNMIWFIRGLSMPVTPVAGSWLCSKLKKKRL